jgi:hypothetical protein
MNALRSAASSAARCRSCSVLLICGTDSTTWNFAVPWNSPFPRTLRCTAALLPSAEFEFRDTCGLVPCADSGATAHRGFSARAVLVKVPLKEAAGNVRLEFFFGLPSGGGSSSTLSWCAERVRTAGFTLGVCATCWRWALERATEITTTALQGRFVSVREPLF